MRLKLFNILVLIVWTGQLLAQSKIVDDTTKQVYGAYTTFYHTFPDIKYNKDNLRKVDTLIYGLQNFTLPDKNENKIVNLGNLGTASRPVFYKPPEEIGLTSGFNAYEPYYYTPDNIKYYDSRSPYTLLNVVLGGSNRNETLVEHNRNITPYLNVGIRYRRISADKQVNSARRGDRQTLSTAYYLHADYQSENGKYVVVSSLSRINHRVKENGGIKVLPGALLVDYFDKNADVYLKNAESSDLRLGFHLYNEYKLVQPFQVYYDFQTVVNKYFYTDNPLGGTSEGNDGAFYDRILISEDSTTNKAQFNQLINEVGLKGDLKKMFYNFYVKFRDMNYIHQYLPLDGHDNEQSGGFNLRYDFDSLQYIHAGGALMLDGNYRIGGKYHMKFLDVEYWRVSSKPAVMQQNYFGNHYQWHNDFNSTKSDYLSGSVTLNYKGIKFKPSFSLSNIQDHIYFGTDKMPAQASGSARILSPGLIFNFRFFKKLFFESELIYTNISGDGEAVNSFRIPEWLANGKIYFSGPLFHSALYLQSGIQMHYKSAYYAPGYAPSIQQFYIQDDFLIPAHVVMDLYADFQIKTFTMFFKLVYVNQKKLMGYFVAPDYIGQRRTFDIGVRWMFFN